MKQINRRTFIKHGVAAGTVAVVGGTRLLSAGATAPVFAAGSPDLTVVKSADYFAAAEKAVDMLGGMKRFVSKNDVVGLLVNAPFRNPGAHVNPDISLAVAKMCHEAGAGKIIMLKGAPGGYWNASGRSGEYGAVVNSLSSAGGYVEHAVSGGVALKTAEVVRDLLDVDVFINASITKHHEGTGFSCILKNMMGALPHSTCRFFHMGTGKSGWYGDLAHMNQCIADVNLVRKPDLAVVDATEFITDNGPFGPGNLARPQQVLASADPVLTDAYCTRFLNLTPDEVGMIQRAENHGLGRADVKEALVKESRV